MTRTRCCRATLGALVIVIVVVAVVSYGSRTGFFGARPDAGMSAQTAASAAAPAPTTPERAKRSGVVVPKAAAHLANQLASATSPYLRAAAGQPVFWQFFGEPAFRLAQALDRPVLLDVGGTWCHWCRVMSEESYGDPTVAALINEHFVPIKIDADERPDLDRRFQQAAQLVAREAGWPLTLFLTPEGTVFAGGTYFAAEELVDRPSLRSMVTTLAESYDARPEAVAATGAQLADQLAVLRDAGLVRGTPGYELVDDLGRALLAAFDAEYGGFGRRAKFPAPQAISFALEQYRRQGDRQYLFVASKTLDAMAAGGIRDQLSGAFHRYSLDPRWENPHFEIIASLNGALAASYLRAYRAGGDERHRAVAERTLDYVNRVFVDRAQGGFYSSQDADVGAGDDGGYYTWTAEEIRAALPPDEAAVALRYYGVDEAAAGIKIDGAPAARRGVLRVAQPFAAVARDLGMSVDEVRAKLESARAHLRTARESRPAPPIDRSFFADRNGTLAAAYLEAYRGLGRTDLRDTALRAIERLLRLPRQDGLLAHAYIGQQPVAPPLLDDQMAVAGALLDAFEVAGERRYLMAAGELLDGSMAALGDSDGGAFFDAGPEASAGTGGGRQRPFDDGLTLGGNPLAALTLDRYARLANSARHQAQAGATLRAFAGAAREYGVFASGYALALSYHLENME